MKKSKSTLLLLLAAGLLLYAACRKTDRMAAPPQSKIPEEHFFIAHPSADPHVQSVAGWVKALDEKDHFIATTIKRIGLPRWDKAVTVAARSKWQRNSSDTANTTYIPFVREDENFVNAAMVVRTSPADTSFQYVLDWQYRYAPPGKATDSTLTGEKVAATLMGLDNEVFGRTSFRLTDTSLFNGHLPAAARGKQREITISRPATIPGLVNRTEQMQTIIICIKVQTGYCNCSDRSNCDMCLAFCAWELCIDYEYDDGTGLGGPGGGSTGGTGGTSGGGSTGGGGGYPPPECPGLATRTAVDPNCGPGWVPPGGGGGGATPPETIDSMLARYARGIDRKADSIFQLSMNSTIKEEWGFPVVQKNGNVYAKRCTTSHRTQTVRLDKYIDAGEMIVGECHTHPDTSSNPLARSAPSGSDLETFNVNSRYGYTLFVECGNIRYALVIENVNLCRAFFALNSPDELMYQQEVIAMQQSGWNVNWQHATEVALIQLLGTANSCGIGFYKSGASKTNFIKLN